MRIFFLVLILLMVDPVLARDRKAKAKAAPAPVEEIKTYSKEEYSSIQSYLEPFIFRGRELRNPFKAPEINIPLVPGKLYGPFLPLQSFRLDQLQVKGLFWNIKVPKAIVVDPKGVTYNVGIKDYIGENFGYIASIREKELVIIQTMEEDGQRFSTTKIMYLTR